MEIANVLYNRVEFEPSFKIKNYSIEQNGKFQQIAQFDCRGLELVDFQARVRCSLPRHRLFQWLILSLGFMVCKGCGDRDNIWRYWPLWRRMGWLWWKGIACIKWLLYISYKYFILLGRRACRYQQYWGWIQKREIKM